MEAMCRREDPLFRDEGAAAEPVHEDIWDQCVFTFEAHDVWIEVIAVFPAVDHAWAMRVRTKRREIRSHVRTIRCRPFDYKYHYIPANKFGD